MTGAPPNLVTRARRRAAAGRTFCEFFAGVGLVGAGVRPSGRHCVHASGHDPDKREPYETRNDPGPHHHLEDVTRTADAADRIPGRPGLAPAAGAGRPRLRWTSPREYARLPGAGDFPPAGPRGRRPFGFADAARVPAVRRIDQDVLTPPHGFGRAGAPGVAAAAAAEVPADAGPRGGPCHVPA